MIRSRLALEPGLVAVYIGGDELLIRLREIDDPFDEADEASNSTGGNRDKDSEKPPEHVT
jgi:hypothetical protein